MLQYPPYVNSINGLLPSFPTRRSSDLLRRVSFPHPIDDQPITLAVQAVQIGSDGAASPLTVTIPVSLKDQKANRDAPLDRKSTRLNSSHRCISYAVFCLKKINRRQIIV